MAKWSKELLVLILILIGTSGYCQSHVTKLCDLFDNDTDSLARDIGAFMYDSTFSNSGSYWELDWDESKVFNGLMKYSNSTNPYQSYELRMGKGGQIYSFKSNGFGEALPPQWRPSFDPNGQSLTDPGPSIPVNSHHGNWAPWNDEVWQFVGSDQKDKLNNSIKTKNIHQGGSYMNNYAHRASDLLDSPFYSPMVQSQFSSSEQSYTSISWGQSENPSYVYDPFGECDNCFSDGFKPSVLYFQRYKNLGAGLIQVDFLMYNYHRTRGIDYWNVPFVGIRNSSLPYAFLSNSSTDEGSYDVLNKLAGHPVPGDEASYLPQFSQGATKKTSGINSQCSGWFGFSTDSIGEGPSLAFVTSKTTSSPNNGYGDIRYGTAMSNALRDVTIFTRRANGGAVDAQTGMKPWGIVAGESIKGRYFIVLDSSISNIVQHIQTKNLVSYANIEIVVIDRQKDNDIYYDFIAGPGGEINVKETDSSSAVVVLNSKPFHGSYPVFLITTAAESVIATNPYTYSLTPYDGVVEKIELLGFSEKEQPKQVVNATVGVIEQKLGKALIYPNPASDHVTIVKDRLGQNFITIYNVVGQDVTSIVSMRTVGSNMLMLNTRNLSDGFYFVKVDDATYAVQIR